MTPAVRIDVLTGRVWYDGAALPRRVTVPKPRARGAWDECTSTPQSTGKATCPEYCKRHCLMAERLHGHTCDRVRHRGYKRRSLARARRAA